MSGTSLDGVDTALVALQDDNIELLAHHFAAQWLSRRAHPCDRLSWTNRVPSAYRHQTFYHANWRCQHYRYAHRHYDCRRFSAQRCCARRARRTVSSRVSSHDFSC
ncbi:anhydro-N-acetylmuramic acid kinase [Vibrio cholerae]|nr:anhydro-N-acetylmuramic acid kinase [Vibrio cholerae]